MLHDQPQVWASIDQRIRALSATDDLIARVDGSGCDIKDLLRSELGPYGHVRFNLNGDPLFLPAKLAVSLALIFHELATNAGKYGAFSSAARPVAGVMVGVGRIALNITWDETEGPAVENVGAPASAPSCCKSALRPFDGKTEISFPEDRRSLHHAMPDTRELNALHGANAPTAIAIASDRSRIDILLMTIGATPIETRRLAATVTVFRSST